jgi:hypothetical protein
MDLRILRRHHGAQCGRIGREQKLVTERAFTRRPKPVLSDHIGAAAHQSDLGRVGGRKLDRLDIEIDGLVEPARLDQLDFPGGRSGFLDGDAQGVGGVGARRQTPASRDSEGDEQHAFDHAHSPTLRAHHPPRRISMPRAGS